MRDIINGLIGLQKCDKMIMEIRKKKEQGPESIRALEEGLHDFERKLEEKAGELSKYKQSRRQAENDVEDLENRIEKSNTKLSNIKSNKEYQAAIKEIEGLVAEKQVLEDRVIEIMEEIEALEELNASTRAEGERLKEKFKKDRDEILKELEILDLDLERLEKERADYCGNIDESLLKKYDLLREHRGGLAVSPVIKGVCQACNMGIPPQKFNELIRGEELMVCPHCKRLIFWGEDERFPETDSKE